MVVYKGTAFNEKLVSRIGYTDNYDSRKNYCNSVVTIRLYLSPEKYDFISFEVNTPEKAISMINELTKLINERENELLKFKFTAE